MTNKIEVFIAFHQDDIEYLRGLKDHLKPLEAQGFISLWDSSQILAGMHKEQEITSHLQNSSIVLLLISASFLASLEGQKLIKRSMNRKVSAGVKVIPILLREVDWEDSDIGSLIPLPTDGKPVSSWQNCDAAYLDIARGLRAIIVHRQEAFVDEKKEIYLKTPTGGADAHVDQLEYEVENQLWYTQDFPKTTGIANKQIDTLKGEVDLVIITATDVELRAIMRFVEPYPKRKSILLAFFGPETYYLGKFGSYKTVITKCRMGSIGEGSVTLAADQALRLWQPRAIIMIGVAFGKDPEKQKIGDVLVASQIISYEQVRVGQEAIFRGTIPPSNTTLLNRFENAPTWHFVRPDGKDCTLFIGPILSGEKLVDDPVFKQKLFQQFPQAIGGEMEGAGLCAASGRIGIAWILIKSICDWGDGKKHKKHQPLAAAAATSLVHHVLSQRNVLDSIEKR